MTQDTLQVEVHVNEPGEIAGAKADLEAVGATSVHVPDDGQQDILPVLAVVGIVVGVSALAALIKRMHDGTQCREVVDARGDEVKLRKDCDFKDGKIIVISKDGQKVEIHDVPDVIDLTKVAEAAVKGGADAVKAAAEAVGAKADGPMPANS